MAVVGTAVSIVTDGSTDPNLATTVVGFMWAVVPLVFTVCGALIVRKKSGNVIGWLLMAPGVASALFLSPILNSETPPDVVDPWIWLQVWIDNISWMLLFFPVFHLLLVYPTGRLLSRRWRIVVALEVLMLAGLGILAAVSESLGPSNADWTVANPIGVIPDRFFDESGPFSMIWSFLLIILTVSGVLAVVLRFKGGSKGERQQIKWLLLAVSVFGAVYASMAFNPQWQSDDEWLVNLVLVASLIGIPVAVLIAVTRYKLYEIDRLVSRTITYALVAGLIAVVIAGIAALAGTRFQEPLGVAFTTLAVASLFNPIRRRIQSLVDRRFNRSRYDLEQVITEFTGSLRNEVDPDRVADRLLQVVAGTMQPISVDLWIRK